ncbi:MAG TPA: FAD-dependent oxidoreductase [Actinomadura sp.]|jgi:glycine/D-amino acid oxidase-like deaminating enzyme|nr:FAD-dependent oxidoreductase [Actinomadura sp.]
MTARTEQIMTVAPQGEERRYDVVVVGGGAAGLSGALPLARARRSVLVIDAGRPRNAPAAHVHAPFSAQMERDVSERVLGDRRHGL